MGTSDGAPPSSGTSVDLPKGVGLWARVLVVCDEAATLSLELIHTFELQRAHICGADARAIDGVLALDARVDEILREALAHE